MQRQSIIMIIVIAGTTAIQKVFFLPTQMAAGHRTTRFEFSQTKKTKKKVFYVRV